MAAQLLQLPILVFQREGFRLLDVGLLLLLLLLCRGRLMRRETLVVLRSCKDVGGRLAGEGGWRMGERTGETGARFPATSLLPSSLPYVYALDGDYPRVATHARRSSMADRRCRMYTPSTKITRGWQQQHAQTDGRTDGRQAWLADRQDTPGAEPTIRKERLDPSLMLRRPLARRYLHCLVRNYFRLGGKGGIGSVSTRP